MFIFDADSHLTLTETPSQTVEQLIRNMDRAGIEKSIIWLQPPYMRVLDDANRYVFESYKKFPDRLVPFGWVDPHFGISNCLDTIRLCLDEYGMYGIKLNGAQNLFDISSYDLEPIYEELEKRKTILAFHIGADFYQYTHPLLAAKVASRHPNLKMLLAHMGGAGLPDLAEICVETAREYHNMMLIGSAVSYRKILQGIKTLGTDRICFGSDAPFALQHVEVAAYLALLQDELNEADLEKVMGLNLQHFLES